MISSDRRTGAEKALLSFLVRGGHIDRETAAIAENYAAAQGRSLIVSLDEKQIVGEAKLAGVMADGLHVPLLDLEKVHIDASLGRLVKEETALRLIVAPVSRDGDVLTLAMANPFDHEAMRQVEFATGCHVRPAVAPHGVVVRAIEQLYNVDARLRSLMRAPQGGHVEIAKREPGYEDTDLNSLVRQSEGAPIVKIVNLIMADGLVNRASDIHIEPTAAAVLVRYRLNGVLQDSLQIPKNAHAAVVARIKVMAKLDITERRCAQDGHLRVRYGNNLVDFRVSTLPTSDGEKVVLRILNSASGLLSLEQIGLGARDLAVLREAVAAPQGMILVTGPTGSGKTTTLYALIREILSAEINVTTIEDPVEYQIAGINQVSVSEKGMTFASALRSILRQDPDVILVGEIRDRETAEVAFQAAQTGHLVLSTLHTNDTVSTIARLLELGVPHEVLAGSLRVVMAQRLVRTLCSKCAEAGGGAEGNGTPRSRRTKGCSECRFSGYGERTGVYETLRISRGIQRLIEGRAPESALRVLAREEGMLTIRGDAVAKVAAGLTTAEEVARVVETEAHGLHCPQCANPIDGKFTFCPFCEAQLRAVCASCGVALSADWKSCPFCGPAHRFGERAAPRDTAAPAAPRATVGGEDVPGCKRPAPPPLRRRVGRPRSLRAPSRT